MLNDEADREMAQDVNDGMLTVWINDVYSTLSVDVVANSVLELTDNKLIEAIQKREFELVGRLLNRAIVDYAEITWGNEV